MKKIIFCMIIILSFFPMGASGNSKKTEKIHPSFLRLLQTQPRDAEILYPSVPRVSAKEAFGLFSAGQALLFGVGEDMIRRYKVLGTITIPLGQEMNPKLLKKLKKVKKKHILVFCG